MEKKTKSIKEEKQEIIVKCLLPDFNVNNMQIQAGTITDIINKCEVSQPCAVAMQEVKDWFNAQQVGAMVEEHQKRYVGAFVSLLALLACNDVAALCRDWLLPGLES